MGILNRGGECVLFSKERNIIILLVVLLLVSFGFGGYYLYRFQSLKKISTELISAYKVKNSSPPTIEEIKMFLQEYQNEVTKKLVPDKWYTIMILKMNYPAIEILKPNASVMTLKVKSKTFHDDVSLGDKAWMSYGQYGKAHWLKPLNIKTNEGLMFNID